MKLKFESPTFDDLLSVVEKYKYAKEIYMDAKSKWETSQKLTNQREEEFQRAEQEKSLIENKMSEIITHIK